MLCARAVLVWGVVLVLGSACVASEPRSSGAEARIAELEEENARLRADLAELRERLTIIGTECEFGVNVHSHPSQPAISATVLEVNDELHFVVLDKGARDGVKAGYTFTVSRGQTYKGQVRVQDVQEDRCSALVVAARNAMVPGDSATTRL